MDEGTDERSTQLQNVAAFIDHQTPPLIAALPRDDENQLINSTTYDALTNSGRCPNTTRNDSTEDQQRTIRNDSENASSSISNITANDSGIATNSSSHHKTSAILNLTERSASFSLQNNDIVDDNDDDYQDGVTYEEENSAQQLQSNVGGDKSEKLITNTNKQRKSRTRKQVDEQRQQKQTTEATRIVGDNNDIDNNASTTETTTSLSGTEITGMSKEERERQSPLRPGAVRVRPNRNDGVTVSSTSSAFHSHDFTVTSDASHDNDGEIQRMPRKSSIFMTVLEATLVDDDNNNRSEEYRHHQEHQSTFASTIVTDAIPIDVTLLEKLQEQKNENNRFASRYHWVLLSAVLLVVVTVVITTASVLLVTRRNSKNNGMTTMYQGNWNVRNFSQITQHFVMINVDMDNCTDSIPNLDYTIQCGPDQTMQENLHDDDNERPNAAIEFEYSVQKGYCIRTQVNVLTCNAAFDVTKVKVGTVISCGTLNETAVTDGATIDPNQTTISADNDDSSLMPLLTIRTYPTKGVSCQVDKTYQNESYNITNNKTTYMTSAESKSLKYVAWISTNRVCNDDNLTNFILDPSSCHASSSMVTIYDPSRNAEDWSYCLSTNAIEAEENNENVTIIPAVTVIDRYNESIFQTTCPYMKEYVAADPNNYLISASAVVARVSD